MIIIILLKLSAGHLTYECRNFIRVDPTKDVHLDISSTSSEESDKEGDISVSSTSSLTSSSEEGRRKRRQLESKLLCPPSFFRSRSIIQNFPGKRKRKLKRRRSPSGESRSRSRSKSRERYKKKKKRRQDSDDELGGLSLCTILAISL